MAIPANARLAYEGAIFKVYEWPQTMFDGSEMTFEAIVRQGTAMVVATQGEDVLYNRQEQPGKAPFLSLFGGRVEWGEDPLVAAKRELLEESGMESDDWQLVFATNPGGKIDWPCHYYLAKNCRKVAEPHLDAGEKIDTLRVPFDRFFEDVLNAPDFRDQFFKSYFYSALNPQIQNEFFSQLRAK